MGGGEATEGEDARWGRAGTGAETPGLIKVRTEPDQLGLHSCYCITRWEEPPLVTHPSVRLHGDRQTMTKDQVTVTALWEGPQSTRHEQGHTVRAEPVRDV